MDLPARFLAYRRPAQMHHRLSSLMLTHRANRDVRQTRPDD
ncbi:MAG: hypothetical protein ACAI34_07220 [Verrucomicrobium sp.]|nr:hypothetical protein [Verrucomicrobium sp.]